MAFSNTVTDKIAWANGLIMEYGTFTGTAVAVGTITASTVTTTSVATQITEILAWGFASDGDTAVLPARDQDPNKIKITFTNGDTGKYYIIGKAR